jgi:hypothetical protein
MNKTFFITTVYIFVLCWPCQIQPQLHVTVRPSGQYTAKVKISRQKTIGDLLILLRMLLPYHIYYISINGKPAAMQLPLTSIKPHDRLSIPLPRTGDDITK